MNGRNIIVYELNEVPWEVIDLYVSKRPRSHLARLLEGGLCVTTVNEDDIPLRPFNTWPTLHKSMYTRDHHATRCGQDPATVAGENIWDIAERHGRFVGLFGPLQSWPPRRFARGGFYVPDTFSRTDEVYPRKLQPFQAFNLSMTERNKSVQSMPVADLWSGAKVLLNLMRNGLTWRSALSILSHVANELRDRRYRGRRSTIQVLPAFDLYWKLYNERKPSNGLSIFFTNHVAGMIHRFWGHAVDGYAQEYAKSIEFRVDPIHRGSIVAAMDLFDRQLGRIVSSLDANDVLVVVSSMGQRPISYKAIREAYVLSDVEAFVAALNLPSATSGPAMYPRMRLCFEHEEASRSALETLQSIMTGLGPLFSRIFVEGPDLVMHILTPALDDLDVDHSELRLPARVTFTPRGTDRAQDCEIGRIGIQVAEREGGGNTAHHKPEGILIAHGACIRADGSRSRVSVLDVAPSILQLLGVPPGGDMRGKPTIFAGHRPERRALKDGAAAAGALS